MGRVLKPGGWAIYHVSTDPAVHQRRPTAKQRAKAALGKAPKGLTDAAWMGSSLTEDQIKKTSSEAGLEIERIAGLGEQFTIVRSRREA